MSREVMWGGRVEGILSGDAVYSGRAFGVFEGEIPEQLDGWVGQILLQTLHAVLEPAAALLAQDLVGLARALTEGARAELASQGVSGTVTVNSCRLDGEPVAVEAPAVAPVASPPPAAPLVVPPSPPATNLNETAAIGQLSPLAKIALPFKPAPGGSSQTEQPRPPDDDHVLPFIDELPDLSVEQYASLCVERSLDPEGEQEVAKRYRILTAQALRSLDERWRQRFEAEGELRRRWQQAHTQYEAWLRSQKG